MSETVDGPTTTVKLLKGGVTVQDISGLPQEMPAVGLSNERSKYLYQNIRQYVRDPWKDSVAPLIEE